MRNDGKCVSLILYVWDFFFQPLITVVRFKVNLWTVLCWLTLGQNCCRARVIIYLWMQSHYYSQYCFRICICAMYEKNKKSTFEIWIFVIESGLFIMSGLLCRIIGRTLAKFTQLKRNKRFDNFIMLVGVQGLLFHIAAGSHPVQEAWGSQDSLYRGQIQKLLQCCQKTIPTDSSYYNDSEKV